jgi:choice-of-anchor A domain-containing protein
LQIGRTRRSLERAVRRIRLVSGLAAILVAAGAAAAASSSARPAATVAHDAACASLGDAANFAVFSDGAFDASDSSGTTITGRIGAAGDVTLDGVTVGPASGDTGPTVIAGGNFTAGQAGRGGTVNGGVRYGGSASVAANFVVNGGLVHASPPFSFSDSFETLKELSSSWGQLGQTAGATVTLAYGALTLTGTGAGLNVFTVSAADLAQASGVVINLTQPGASALINVTTDTDLAVALQYMNFSGSAGASNVVWNLPLATSLSVTRGVLWQGLILAPNASVTAAGRPQLNGELIAATVPGGDWVFNHVLTTACLPEPTPAPEGGLSLKPLCVDGDGNLDMQLENTLDHARAVAWTDLTAGAFGQFEVPAGSDYYFVVPGGSAGSEIQATADATTVRAAGTDKRCRGSITVKLVVVGDAPAGTTWIVRINGGDHGNVDEALTLAAGESGTVSVPGGYQVGAAPIGEVVGGVAYTISEDDAHGADVTISLNPVEILEDQDQFVTVTNTYPAGGGTTEPMQPAEPDQPTLPPGAPDPPSGPDALRPGPGTVPGAGADLAITHAITPSRLPEGGVITTVTKVRNLGPETAVGTVAREIPQYRPAQANSVAHVLSLSTTRGTCTMVRPVRCALGALAPGATVTIRTRTRVLVAAALQSIVVVSSQTPDANTANNMAEALVTTVAPTPRLRTDVSAPATGHVAAPFSYVVRTTALSPGGASTVRLCNRPPSTLVEVRAPGTFRDHGSYCLDADSLARGKSLSFTVFAIPSATGPLTLPAQATALAITRPVRGSARLTVLAPLAVCARARHQPQAHAAC